MKKKIVSLVLVFALALALGIGGTIAWLTDKTDSVVNTFTVGNIDIELSEEKGGTNKEFKMVPGNTIEKDPKVTVVAGSEACWLFVKVEESATPVLTDYIEYSVDADWGKLVDGVYYRKVAANTANQDFNVLTGNQVKVKDDVTKAMMDALEADDATLPKLTFTAAAIQSDNIEDVYEAWDNLPPEFKGDITVTNPDDTTEAA